MKQSNKITLYEKKLKEAGPEVIDKLEKKNIKILGRKCYLQIKAAAKKELVFRKKRYTYPPGLKTKGRKLKALPKYVLVFMLKLSGELKKPELHKVHAGNILIIDSKVYILDAQSFWTMNQGMRTYKVVLIKEYDRNPIAYKYINNEDANKMIEEGRSTMNDEAVLKAALSASVAFTDKKQPINPSKIIMVLIAVAIVGAIIYFIANSGAATG